MQGCFCSKIICFSLSNANNYIWVECRNWLHFKKNCTSWSCISATRSLASDAERERQNRIYGGYFYGELKIYKRMASFHLSCSTVAGNMPYFLKLLPSFCFGFPKRISPFSKLNIYSLRVQKLILQSSVYWARYPYALLDHLYSEHWRASRV